MERLGCVVVAHRDLYDILRKESGPGQATVGATEQRAGLGVHHAWVDRVEEKELDGSTQIEAVPVASAIGGDVVASHVAGGEKRFAGHAG